MTRIHNLFPSSQEKEKVQSQSVGADQQSLDQTLCTMRHLAIIMDGNGRWATQRHLPRLAGHKAGVNALRRVLEFAVDEHIEMLVAAEVDVEPEESRYLVRGRIRDRCCAAEDNRRSAGIDCATLSRCLGVRAVQGHRCIR